MSRPHISADLRRRVAGQSRHRCGYCLSAEAVVGAAMELDHITPVTLGGQSIEENLWLACSACNDHKNDRIAVPDPATGEITRLFDPRRENWSVHFAWDHAGTHIVGLTRTGRATVAALQLNRPVLVVARAVWVAAGWHPPRD